MKKILIVLQDTKLVTAFKARLQKPGSNDEEIEEIIVVDDSPAALQILRENTVNLLINELKVESEYDSFNLLAYTARKYPQMQVVVLSGLAKSKLGSNTTFHCVNKPRTLSELSLLTHIPSASFGTAGGMLVRDFFQLIEVAKKTCLLEIGNNEDKGLVYFYQGELFNGFCRQYQGEQAILKMLSKKCSEITFKQLPQKAFRRQITTPLTTLLTKKTNIEEEKGQQNTAPKTIKISTTTKKENKERTEKSMAVNLLKAKIQELKSVDKIIEINEDKVPDKQVFSVDNKTTAIKINQKIGKEIMAALEDTLKPLQEVDGYLASAIFDMGGEVLAQHNNSKYDVSLIGANAVAMINAAVKAVGGAGLGKCNFIQVNSEKGIFGAVWAVEDQSVAAVLLEPKANIGLAKLALAKVGEVSGSRLA